MERGTMLEGKFNSTLLKSIKACGVFCYKTADRFKPGVLDLYVVGGNWIECKVIKVGNQNRVIDVASKMTEHQHNFADDLLKAGDRVIFCARIEAGKNHLMIVPYTRMISRQWRVIDLCAFPTILTEKRYDLSSYFNTAWDRNVDPAFYPLGE